MLTASGQWGDFVKALIDEPIHKDYLTGEIGVIVQVDKENDCWVIVFQNREDEDEIPVDPHYFEIIPSTAVHTLVVPYWGRKVKAIANDPYNCDYHKGDMGLIIGAHESTKEWDVIIKGKTESVAVPEGDFAIILTRS